MEMMRTVADIEKELSNIYKERKALETIGYCTQEQENRYDMEMEALYESEQYYREELHNTYPHAFDVEYVDDSVYEDLSIMFEQNGVITPEDILNVTKLDDTDGIYMCKVRSMHRGKFINNYVCIYLDNEYRNKETRMMEDCEMTCAAICYALGPEFVTVLECTKKELMFTFII